MGFHINDKKGKKTGSNNQKSSQGAAGSKFILKANNKSSGPAKKPVKTGGSRGS